MPPGENDSGERTDVSAPASRSRQPQPVYYERELIMAAENLADLISKLTLEQQEIVKQFVEFLRRRESPPSSPFLAAVDEFIDQHPELLRRLAQ
jgi:hypothetical protein